MLVHSRLEMIDPEIRFILKDSIPSMHMQVVLPSDDRVFMHFIELSLESGAEAEQEEPDMNRTEGEQIDEKIEDGKQQKDE